MTPNDTLIGPIVNQLIQVAQQIEGIGICYPNAPDKAPDDNSVLFPVKNWEIMSAMSGRLDVKFTVEIMHLFNRKRLSDVLSTINAFVPAWWSVLTAWSNQRLGGLAEEVNVTKGQITQIQHAGQTYIALVHTVEVVTEIDIPVS